MSGPPPKPTKLKILEGNPSKRPLNKNEPQPAPGMTHTPPAHLSPKAKAEWRRVVPELDRIGLLTKVDRAELEGYCEAYATWREATAILRREGVVHEGPHGLARHPAGIVADQAGKAMLAFAREYGLTPASRSKISLPELPADELGQLLA